MKKKIKGPFYSPSNPSVTINQFRAKTRAGALVVRVEHWTPKGDYTERGDKERYRNESDQKKRHRSN